MVKNRNIYHCFHYSTILKRIEKCRNPGYQLYFMNESLTLIIILRLFYPLCIFFDKYIILHQYAPKIFLFYNGHYKKSNTNYSLVIQDIG